MSPQAMLPYLLLGNEFAAGGELPLTDRGFRYGMSVFETIALRAGRPLFLDAHLAKLAEAATRAGLHPPAGWAPAARAALLAPPVAEGVARLYLTAGDHDATPGRAALLFEALPIPTDLPTAVAVAVAFTPALPFGKTGNYWPHLLARPANGDEAILCTPAGGVLGGAMSNVFLLLDSGLATPREPVRRGVVRDWVGAAEEDLTRADLALARAAFLTNSRFGLCELTAIDGRTLPGDPCVEVLQRRYRAEVLGVR